MNEPSGFEQFSNAIGNVSGHLTAFADASVRAVSGVSGLTDSVRSLSRTVTGMGVGLAHFFPSAKIAGLGVSGVGLAGMAAGGIASAGLNLAGAASPNGLQSVNSAFDQLAGTIGTMVIPGVVALGGLALMAADAASEWIKEHRGDIIKFWTNAVEWSTDKVKSFGEALEGIGGVFDTFGMMADQIGRQLGLVKDGPQAVPFANADLFEKAKRGEPFPGWGPNGIPRALAPLPGEGVAAAPQQPAGAGNPFLAKLADKMDVIAKDMQASLGTTGMTDPASRWKEVAIALQKSDLELRKMTMFQEAMQLVRDFIGELRRNAGPRPAMLGGGAGRLGGGGG